MTISSFIQKLDHYLERASKRTPGKVQASLQDSMYDSSKWWDMWSMEGLGSIAHLSETARPDENLRRLKWDAKFFEMAFNHSPELVGLLKEALEVIEFYGGFQCETDYLNRPLPNNDGGKRARSFLDRVNMEKKG